MHGPAPSASRPGGRLHGQPPGTSFPPPPDILWGSSRRGGTALEINGGTAKRMAGHLPEPVHANFDNDNILGRSQGACQVTFGPPQAPAADEGTWAGFRVQQFAHPGSDCHPKARPPVVCAEAPIRPGHGPQHRSPRLRAPRALTFRAGLQSFGGSGLQPTPRQSRPGGIMNWAEAGQRFDGLTRFFLRSTPEPACSERPEALSAPRQHLPASSLAGARRTSHTPQGIS